ncbi:MAG TPA: DNA-binding protein [bacterium]|nr:DNA-binding protein [bacterium]HOM25972.1 DNA-binding protein [bacterium]
MKKLIFILLFSTLIYSSEKVKIKELFENSKKYNGKSVIIEGEAIGEIMGRGKEKWVNIKDVFEDFAIGVVVSEKDAKIIENLGSYKVKGDILRIEGIYNVNCLKHQGERDIHAVRVEIVKKGERYKEEIILKKVILCFLLLIITSFLMTFAHKKEISAKE